MVMFDYLYSGIKINHDYLIVRARDVDGSIAIWSILWPVSITGALSIKFISKQMLLSLHLTIWCLCYDCCVKKTHKAT